MNNKGFTLIEVMIVMAIISILFAIFLGALANSVTVEDGTVVHEENIPDIEADGIPWNGPESKKGYSCYKIMYDQYNSRKHRQEVDC